MRYLWARQMLAIKAVIALTGLVLVLASGVLVRSGTQPSIVMFSLGVSVLTSVFVTLVSSALGADVLGAVSEQLKFHKVASEVGLQAVHTSLNDETIFNGVSRARRLDILYATGLNFIFRHGRSIALALDAGCQVRLLLLHPESSYLEDEEFSSALNPGIDIRSEITAVLANVRQLVGTVPAESGKSSVEVRGYRCAPTGSTVIINRRHVRHTPYLPYIHNSEVPIFDFERSRDVDVVAIYERHFEEIWERSDLLISHGAV